MLCQVFKVGNSHRKIFGRYINAKTSGGRQQVDLNKLGWNGVEEDITCNLSGEGG